MYVYALRTLFNFWRSGWVVVLARRVECQEEENERARKEKGACNDNRVAMMEEEVQVSARQWLPWVVNS